MAGALLSLASPGTARADADRPSDEHQPSSAATQTKDKPPATDVSARPAQSLKKLPLETLRDQKFLWLRPFRLKRDDIPWAAAILGTTAGLIAIDRRVAQKLSEKPPGAGYGFSRRVGQIGSGLTDFGVAGTFYLLGRCGGDERARNTGLLGMRALVDSLVIGQVLKAASQRPRPTIAGGRVRNHNADGEFFAGGQSFPSNHAAEAWAVAAVIADQYRHRLWVPPTAYSLAGLVAVARVTQRRHFPADVFVGSVLGYLIGRHASRGATRQPNTKLQRLQLLPYMPPTGGSALLISWSF